MRLTLWAVLIISFLFSLAGCDQSETPEAPAPSPALTASISTPALTPTPGITPAVTEPAGPPLPVDLSVWIIPDVAPAPDSAAGQLLSDQLASFSASHPEIELNVEVKVPTGQASILSYLRTGRSVAPAVMPDLVVLPVDQLSLAASEQLIYPLDGVVSQSDWDDLFPAAATMATYNEARVGYPFVLNNLYHLAANGTTLTSTIPITWDGFLLLDSAQMILPGSGPEGAELLLEYYLDAGGTLTNESNETALQVEPLTTALTVFQQGRTQGRILVQSSNHTSLDSTWVTFESGVANVTQTSASQYLNRGLQPGEGILAASLPGYETTVAPLVKGWAWAISATDPTKQALAGELLNWLISGPNLGEWSWQKQVVPGRRAAFESWPADQPYTTFVRAEAERARAFPSAANNAVISSLSTALFEVLTLSQTPQAAAQAAVQSLGG